jgi:ADP-heptose:LPS heptosyltransferase
MGDVAMCVPVIKLLLQQHPDLTITFVSDKKLAPFFANIENCEFIGADLKGEHKGFVGLYQLFRVITNKHKIDAIADLHSVVRTHVLKLFFRLSGKTIFSINKGRAEKKQLTAKHKSNFHQLPTGFERYSNVFQQIGYTINLQPSLLKKTTLSLPETAKKYFENKLCIGVAPFAKHAEKMYEVNKMKLVVEELSKLNINILLFGGGTQEKYILDSWINENHPNVINITGKFKLQEELAIISHLKLMCCMDSANMHLSSMYNIPVVSIWGATHPYAGFLGWGQSDENVISVDLPCRPCSVYGNKKCWRGDHACMEKITPEKIISTIQFIVSNEKPFF